MAARLPAFYECSRQPCHRPAPSRGTTFQTLTEHRNGNAWTAQASPNPSPGRNELESVAAISPTDVWAVGSRHHESKTLVERWNGKAWKG